MYVSSVCIDSSGNSVGNTGKFVFTFVPEIFENGVASDDNNPSFNCILTKERN